MKLRFVNRMGSFFIGLFVLIALTFVVISQASRTFYLNAAEEVSQMPHEGYGSQKVREEMLKPLPPIVQKWLTRSGVIGKTQTSRVFLKQNGHMRTKINGKWMPVTAEQHFTIKEPAFIWLARITAASFIHIAGKDKYQGGHGHMLIKLLSVFKVADAKGMETDQGSLLRYLAETVWFPSAALSDYISWKKSGSSSAIATMSYGGTTSSGKFNFSAEGDLISFEALRYYDRKGGATLESWLVSVDPNSFKVFEGIRIPTKSSVTWKLKEGDFNWFNLVVTEVHYDR